MDCSCNNNVIFLSRGLILRGYTAPKLLTRKKRCGGGFGGGSGEEKIQEGLGERSCGGRWERPAGIKVLLTQAAVIFF